MKWFIMQLNPSSLCLKERGNTLLVHPLAVKIQFKVYYFLFFKTPASQSIAQWTWKSLYFSEMGFKWDLKSLRSFIVAIPRLTVCLDSDSYRSSKCILLQKINFFIFKHKTNGKLDLKKDLGMILFFLKSYQLHWNNFRKHFFCGNILFS